MDVSFTGILSHVEGMVKGGMESGTCTAADLCFSLQVRTGRLLLSHVLSEHLLLRVVHVNVARKHGASDRECSRTRRNKWCTLLFIAQHRILAVGNRWHIIMMTFN